MSQIQQHCEKLQKFSDDFVQETAREISICDVNQQKELSALQRKYDKLSDRDRKNAATMRALRSSNASLKQQVKTRDARIENLRDNLEMMKKQAFGSKSDRLSPGPAPTEEEELKMAELSVSASETSPTAPEIDGSSSRKTKAGRKFKARGIGKKRKGRQKRRLGENIETQVIDHGPETCPCGCGGSILGHTASAEWITVPARHLRVEHRFRKYRCRCEGGKIKSFLPEKRILPGTTASASMLAYFVALKFDWFMPTYRQQRIMWQEGVFIHRSTISRNINTLALRVFELVADAIYEEIVGNSDVIHIDETSHYLLVNGNGKRKKRSLIAIARDERGFCGLKFPAAYYRAFPSNSQAAHEKLLRNRNLIAVHDGHACFNRFGEFGSSLEGIVSAGCWSHVRRHFVDAYNILKRDSAKSIVGMIDRMFDLERILKGRSSRNRKRFRRVVSAKILKKIHLLLTSLQGKMTKDDRLDRAVNYTLRHWKRLTIFLDDGRIEIENNTVERAFKSPILLRNAAMFSASKEGERAWAIFFTLSETCRMNGVNFYKYLMWAMEEIVRCGEEVDHRILMPWNAPTHCHGEAVNLT